MIIKIKRNNKNRTPPKYSFLTEPRECDRGKGLVGIINIKT